MDLAFHGLKLSMKTTASASFEKIERAYWESLR